MEGIIDQKTALQCAQFASAASTLFMAGYGFAFSQSAVPQLYDVKPQISTPIFKQIYYQGAKVVPPGAIIAAASSGYLAYILPEQRNEYIKVAASAVATQLWTIVIMLPSIKRLIKISESDEKTQGRIEMSLEHRQLMIKWVRQNWIRTGIALFGGVTALKAMLS